LVMARDVAGNDMRVAAGLDDAVRDLLAGLSLARGDHDLGAELCQQLRRSAADAAARAGDDGDLAGEIEGGFGHCCSFLPSSLRGAQTTKQSSPLLWIASLRSQ